MEPRYPGDLPDATEDDTRTSVDKACEILATALKDLEDHGYDQKEEPEEEKG